MSDKLPEAKFDPTKARPVYPKPQVKFATLVPIPHEYPTFIQPEWDTDGTTPQVFYGDYYLILDRNGRGRYGSARDQWENMHRHVPLDRIIGGTPAMAWIKVLVPQGYAVSEECVIITLIPTEDGQDIRESRKAIKSGTLVLQQPGGEFQFVRPQDQATTYYSHEEAQDLRLYDMDQVQFENFVFEQALRSLLINV